MKIGPKLAIAFVILTVIPVAVVTYVNKRSTVDLGQQMSARAETVFAERLTNDIDRASSLGADVIAQALSDVLAETVRNANEIGIKLSDEPDPAIVTQILETDFAQAAGQDQSKGLNLERGNVRFEADVERDQVASDLARLYSLIAVGRTTYLRNRDVVSSLTLMMEKGYTIWYPGGSHIEPEDLREADWYLDTLERNAPMWVSGVDADQVLFYALAPINEPDGSLAGVMRLVVPVQHLMKATIPDAAVPAGASSYLIMIPKDHPNLFPHVLASFDPEKSVWAVESTPEPVSVNGDDAWLKVISDMRSGVDGLISVVRDNRSEVWSFRPISARIGEQLYLATVLPGTLVADVRAEAQSTVGGAFRAQIESAAVFAFIAAIVGVTLALFGAKTLTAPIRRLHTASRELAEGDFSVRVPETGSDELAELARGFNEIAPALEERLRVQKDLHVAQEIQQHLISRTPPDVPGFDIAGKTIYCDETGGDYQDFIQLGPDGRAAAVIGDVTGHGVGAALLMATARASLRAHASRHDAVNELIDRVNADLSADSSGGRFLTLLFLDLVPETKTIQWISAGHEPALLYDPTGGRFTELAGGDIPLGVDATWSYSSSSQDLAKDAVLVAYTDGVREANDQDGRQFGVDRIKKAIEEAYALGSTAIATRILDDVREFRGDLAQRDDISVMVIRLN